MSDLICRFITEIAAFCCACVYTNGHLLLCSLQKLPEFHSKVCGTLTGPLIGEQLVSLPAATLKASHSVPANLITAAITHAALVDIWNGKDSKTLEM